MTNEELTVDAEKLREFLRWLQKQDYWINKNKVEMKFPNLVLKERRGITAKDVDGATHIPRRDYRKAAEETLAEVVDS